MSYLSRCTFPTPPRNLCDLLLRDVASLIVTSRLVTRTLRALRPECLFSRELTAMLDSILTLSALGESRLHESVVETGAILPPAADASAGNLITGLFARLPTAVAPGVPASEFAVNLRLLAQHIELKARLASEEAMLVGQVRLGHALRDCSADWRACSQSLRAVATRLPAA
ncbi:MAG: hypothetical protein JNG83_05455 [Opitutaceae bacterium]|nr:hypothetical protein [Opitutaceae bacterium]